MPLMRTLLRTIAFCIVLFGLDAALFSTPPADDVGKQIDHLFDTEIAKFQEALKPQRLLFCDGDDGEGSGLEKPWIGYSLVSGAADIAAAALPDDAVMALKARLVDPGEK